jgi:His-Xaa-Ser repeat protein HxsA
MTVRRFLIPGLFAAGFGSHDPAQASFIHATTTGKDDPNAGTVFRLFRQDHYVILAQHRSHSSHSSHRSGGSGHYSHSSHTSHRSGSGGYDPYYSPPARAPVYSPPPPPPPAPPPAPGSSRPRATPPAESPSPRDRLATPQPGSRAAAPRGDALPALSGRSHRFTAIVRRVQIALLAQGYFEGAINGTVGPAMRAAIRRFQQARGLTRTGTITPALLDALMIASD